MVKNRKLLAEQLVEESVVLLKNENQLLPLQEGQTVAVFGRSALVDRKSTRLNSSHQR